LNTAINLKINPMNKEFEVVTKGIISLVEEWEPRLLNLPEPVIAKRRNRQNRTIRQIVGHMIDSASNNTHRIVHLQYQSSPFRFPNYATNGNNDRWIAIQDYQHEDWSDMVQLWKFANRHIVHVIQHVDSSKLDQQWYYSEERLITLKEGIIDYLRHFRLHLDEISELIDNQ
jgi:hypothetical protein